VIEEVVEVIEEPLPLREISYETALDLDTYLADDYVSRPVSTRTYTVSSEPVVKPYVKKSYPT